MQSRGSCVSGASSNDEAVPQFPSPLQHQRRRQLPLSRGPRNRRAQKQSLLAPDVRNLSDLRSRYNFEPQVQLASAETNESSRVLARPGVRSNPHLPPLQRPRGYARQCSSPHAATGMRRRPPNAPAMQSRPGWPLRPRQRCDNVQRPRKPRLHGLRGPVLNRSAPQKARFCLRPCPVPVP